MKKPTSRNFATIESSSPRNEKPVDNRATKLLSKKRRYVYTEQDLGHDRLHMGITAATYAALSTTF